MNRRPTIDARPRRRLGSGDAEPTRRQRSVATSQPCHQLGEPAGRHDESLGGAVRLIILRGCIEHRNQKPTVRMNVLQPPVRLEGKDARGKHLESVLGSNGRREYLVPFLVLQGGAVGRPLRVGLGGHVGFPLRDQDLSFQIGPASHVELPGLGAIARIRQPSAVWR